MDNGSLSPSILCFKLLVGGGVATNFSVRAIINLSVQVSHRHRNSWKAHILPQKVYKSANWNESSVEWTLVDLDFAFVNDFQFSVCPSATKMNYKCSYCE